MYKELANLIYSYTVEKRDIDKDFIENSIDLISDQFDVKDYISDINFLDKNSFLFGAYNLKNKSLSINPEHIAIKNKSNLKKGLEIVSTLFHELDHASIKKEYETGSDEIIHRLFYFSGVELSDQFGDKKAVEIDDIKKFIRYIFTYNFNHDLAPFERRANINSIKNMKYLILELFITDGCVELLSDEESKELFITSTIANKMYYNYLFDKYKKRINGITNSPSYDYCNKLGKLLGHVPEEVSVYNKSKIESFNYVSSEYDFDKRLLYGLQLTNEELKNAKSDNKPKRLFKRVNKNSLTKK